MTCKVRLRFQRPRLREAPPSAERGEPRLSRRRRVPVPGHGAPENLGNRHAARGRYFINSCKASATYKARPVSVNTETEVLVQDGTFTPHRLADARSVAPWRGHERVKNH